MNKAIDFIWRCLEWTWTEFIGLLTWEYTWIVLVALIGIPIIALVFKCLEFTFDIFLKCVGYLIGVAGTLLIIYGVYVAITGGM